MAMKARVTNANGRIIATKRAGVRSYHQHDALGNTIALITANAVTDTYTYWPYGELRTSTGSTTNPFKFCGAWGYYTDTTGRTYVRARTLRPGLMRWMTVDLFWPKEHAYRYVEGSPTSAVDAAGLSRNAPNYLCVRNLRVCIRGLKAIGLSDEEACRNCKSSHNQNFVTWPWKNCKDLMAWYRANRPWSGKNPCNGGKPGGAWPQDFYYASYCGAANVQHPDLNILPHDCIDECCFTHDRCLEGYYGLGFGEVCSHACCDPEMARCADRVLKSGCCDKANDPAACKEAAGNIREAFSALAGWFIFTAACIGCPDCGSVSPSKGLDKHWKEMTGRK